MTSDQPSRLVACCWNVWHSTTKTSAQNGVHAHNFRVLPPHKVFVNVFDFAATPQLDHAFFFYIVGKPTLFI
jgi:hypothetical protein